MIKVQQLENQIASLMLNMPLVSVVQKTYIHDHGVVSGIIFVGYDLSQKLGNPSNLSL